MPKIICPQCSNINHREKHCLGNSVFCDCGFRIWLNDDKHNEWCLEKIQAIQNDLKRELIFNVTKEQKELEKHEKENFKSEIIPDMSFHEWYRYQQEKRKQND